MSSWGFFSALLLCGNIQQWLSMSSHVKCYSSLPVLGGWGGDHPSWWIKLKRLVFRPLPKMINPYTEHYWAVSGCAFSSPLIVLFLLLPSSVSLPIIWKEEKNVWMEEGDFPTVTQLGKIRHCRQVPIPVPCRKVRRRSDRQRSCGWMTILVSVFKKGVMEKLNVTPSLPVGPRCR